jgi:hypothetical protein
MADVFYAVAPTGTPVAVKLLRAGGGVPRTCQREYRLASAVDGDCTAPVLGHGVSTAGPYLVTAYLAGYRCATTLVGRPTPVGQLWTFGSALAQVLAAVHARGVVHCDVKPSNLLIRGEDVRVIDLGIARHMGQRCGGDGMVECSRGWAAPEQLRTAPATPAVDVFAWGCVLAYLAGGVHPFASHGEQEWILRVQSAGPDSVGVPPGPLEVIRQSQARDPSQRPSARELAATCRACGDARPRTVRPARLAGPAAVGRRRLPRVATGLRRSLRTLRRTFQDRATDAGLAAAAEHPSTWSEAVGMTAPPTWPPGRDAAAGPDGALGRPDAGSPADCALTGGSEAEPVVATGTPANRHRHDERTSAPRLADSVTAVFGSWRFIVIQTGHRRRCGSRSTSSPSSTAGTASSRPNRSCRTCSPHSLVICDARPRYARPTVLRAAAIYAVAEPAT